MSLGQIQETGEALHESYVQARILQASVPISNTIPRNAMYTFANRPDSRSKRDEKLGVLKKNTVLVTQLFLSLKSRPDADMADFFRYENQREPPALADHGMLRTGTKSDILKCLEDPTAPSVHAHDVTVKVVDMAAVVHMVRPTRAPTFSDYVPMHLAPYLKSLLGPTVQRLDAVWDTYPEWNLKMQAHLRRGNGPRTQLGPEGKTPIPKRDWQKYLSNSDNKKELFVYCSRQLANIDIDGILIVTTTPSAVLTNQQNECDLAGLFPCNHAEADSRIILHLMHAVSQGHTDTYVRTVDSDVVVLAIAFFDQLCLSKLWIGLGTGKHYRDIPIHDIKSALGPTKSLALPLFHSLSGCDTTSQLLGIGKKTAWSTWQSMPELTETLLNLTHNPQPFSMDSDDMKQLERFFVLMYSRSCSATSVDEARLQLFSHGSRTLEALPPTKAALYQHVKRAILQACFFWKQSVSSQ